MNLCSRFVGCACQSKSHFPAGQIGDTTDWVDGLKSRPCADEHFFTLQDFGLKQGGQLVQQFIGLQHAPIAHLATGLVALAHPKYFCAILAQLRHIALRSGMRPHFFVHGRCE